MKKTTELLRVMRNEKFYRDGKEDESVKRIVKSYADRIEDAIKWDYTGNVVKLREALGVARELLLPQCHYDIPYSKNCFAAVEKIDSALATPPRNCDLYSHEEALQIWAAKEEKDIVSCFDVWLYEKGGEE